MSTKYLSTATPSLETLSEFPSETLRDRQKTHFFKESVSSDIKNLYDGVFTELPCEPETSFSPEPSYPKTNHYTTTIAANGDATDIYYPIVDATTYPGEFPIALLLQGAQVDKADYSNFASQVASYGFIVVVPNHQRTLTAPTGQSFTGLFSEPQQVNDVLEQMVIEDHNPDSPIAEIVDTDKLGLLGHSFGGSVGLGASQTDICIVV